MKNIKLLFAIIFLPIFLVAQDLVKFTVQGDEINGITAVRADKMKLVMNIFEKVVNDKDFQKEVSTFSYEYDIDTDPNKTLTPQQVAIKLFEGQEFYKKQIDNTANLHWEIVKKNKPWFSKHPAIGYGLPSEIQIYTYTWFFDNSDIPSIVGHIAHEWSHKLGFDHQFDPHPGRENTVPYVFGDIVTRYAKKYSDNN